MKPLIFMPIIVESCSGATSSQKNTGSDSECLEGVTTRLAVAKSAFRFATLTSFKTLADWTTAITAKDLVPLFNVYEVADNNTEATEYETGNFSFETQKEIKKMTAESHLGLPSHAALRSYRTGDYTQVFEITEKGEVLGLYDNDGIQIKGQDITEFKVSIRNRATPDKPPFTQTDLTFRDYEEFEENAAVIKPTWDPETVDGIFNLQLEVQGTPSATEIQVKALIGNNVDTFDTLAFGDWVFTGGSITSHTVVAGVYILVGTGLVSGNLSTGVVSVSGKLVEAPIVAVTI